MSRNNFNNMNPMYGVYGEIEKIMKSIIVKYNYMADNNETLESSRNADEYLSIINNKDRYDTYKYTAQDYTNASIDILIAQQCLYDNNYSNLTNEMKEALYITKRNGILLNYVEKNEYYRLLNGLPKLNTDSSEYYTINFIEANIVNKRLTSRFNIDGSIPIHKIQDYYNNLEPTHGDYIITNIEGLGVIDAIIKWSEENRPDKDERYLHYLGSRRIPIDYARQAKNFQILYIEQSNVKNSLYDQFISCYEACRDYFVSTIFVRDLRKFIQKYDNFIAMCIMVMAIQKTLNRQFPLGIDREFYNDYTLKMLYDAYGIPYNLEIDEMTQRRICQNLNMLIQKKATDKVIYDIAELLGYSNLSVFKYYLGKEHKLDKHNVPIFKWTQKFNDVTGELETVPDYEAMYDVYFQKVELRETDFIKSFNDRSNKMTYESVTGGDPFWWSDSNLYKQVWETEYNYVETKYLNLAVSYKMTELLYDNMLLLKMLINEDKVNELSSIKISLPNISRNFTFSIFDSIILLFCLTAKSHHLRGEIIEVPSHIVSVLEYLKNVNDGNDTGDSFSFDFNFFNLFDNVSSDATYPYAYDPDGPIAANHDERDRLIYDTNESLINKVRDVIRHTKTYKTSCDAYYFGYAIEDSIDSQLTPTEYARKYPDITNFNSYISNLNINPSLSNGEKRIKINEIFDQMQNLTHWLYYKMTETTDRHDYEVLKNFYNAAYYSREVKSMFTINHGTSSQRTAKTFFEFLYYYNPRLYNILFTPNYEGQYAKYKENNPNTTYTLDNYIEKVVEGEIDDFTYSTLNEENSDIKVTETLIYYYIDHIVSKLKQYIDKLTFVHKVNGSATDLDKLLIKLVVYFKSFTVDVIGMDTIYIMDIKLENQMRFFDEININAKNVQADDELRLSFADHVKLSGTSYSGVAAGSTMYYDDRPKNEDHFMTDKVIINYDISDDDDVPNNYIEDENYIP